MQFKIFDRFKRVNDKTSQELLDVDEAAVLKDCVLDYTLGKPRKRGGFGKFDTGATAGDDILVIDDIVASGKNYLIAAVADEVRTYDISLNSWADWVIALNSGFKFRMLPWKDKFIFVFDTDDDPVMGESNLSDYNNLQMTEVGSVETIQSFQDSGGNLTDTTLYKWIIVGRTADGQLTPPSRPFTHFNDATRDDTTASATATMICFTELPYISDSRVVSRLIYRTKGTNNISSGGVLTGEVYYHAATLDNDSTGSEYQTEWEDNIPDSELGTDIVIYLNMPTRAKYLAFNRDRLFLGNFTQVNRQFICPPSSYTITGTHTTGAASADLVDENASFTVDGLIGMTVFNTTNSESATITDNDATTVVGALSGGESWDVTDTYVIASLPTGDNLDGTYTVGDEGFAIDISSSSGGSGTLLDATQYDYRIHFEDNNGRISRYYHNLSIITPTASNDHTVAIKGIGRLGNVAALQFPNRLIYRRTAGAGSYYLIERGNVTDGHGFAFNDAGRANKTETWSDPDTSTTAHPSRVLYSDIEAPSMIKEENYVEIFPEDGDVITGMHDDIDGVIVFKEQSICKIFTSGSPINWGRFKLRENVGCSNPETLQKRGNTYYFVHDGKAYRYTVGGEEEYIGITFQDTFDTITTWYDSAVSDEWYIIQCSDGTTNRTLVYDMKLGTWYNFTRGVTATYDQKTAHIIKHGADAGTILSNTDAFVSDYVGADTTDTETGSTVQISPLVETRTELFPDGVAKIRPRKVKLYYNKTASQNTAVIVYDQESGTGYPFTDSTSSGMKTYEVDISNVAKCSKVSMSVGGAGMLEFGNLRLGYREIKEGRRG